MSPLQSSVEKKPVLVGVSKFFSQLPSSYTDRLAEVSTIVNIRKGEQLQIGRPTDGFVGVSRTGILYLRTYASIADKVGVVSEFFKPGQFISLPAGQNNHRIFGATSASVVGFPYPLFIARLDKAPVELLRWEMQQLHDRLMQKDLDRLAAKQARSEARLASLYWSLSEPLEDGNRKVSARISQSIIAEHLGLSREEVSRKKTLLEKAGFIQDEGRTLVLNRAAALALSLFSETAELRDEQPLQHNGSPLDIPPVEWLRPGVEEKSTPVASIYHPPEDAQRA